MLKWIYKTQIITGIALALILSGCDQGDSNKEPNKETESKAFVKIASCAGKLDRIEKIVEQRILLSEMSNDYYNIASHALEDVALNSITDAGGDALQLEVEKIYAREGSKAALDLMQKEFSKCAELRGELPTELASIADKEYSFGTTESESKGTEASNESPTQFPNIDGLSYREARNLLISSGWIPVPNIDRSEAPPMESYFIEKGFTEVNSCSGGAAFCSFYFKGPNGQSLKVVSVGEEDENATPPYYAKVDNYSITSSENSGTANMATPQSDAEFCTSVGNTMGNMAQIRDSGKSLEEVFDAYQKTKDGIAQSEFDSIFIPYSMLAVYGGFSEVFPAQMNHYAKTQCMNLGREQYAKLISNLYNMELNKALGLGLTR